MAPELGVYRRRGQAQAYRRSCGSGIWGCRMPVEISVDHWKPDAPGPGRV